MEKMHFQTEVSKLLNIVTHSLYSKREIFLRELISNSSDACDKLRYEAMQNKELVKEDNIYSIRVSFDKDKKTITVKDNGIGMNKEDLINNLGTIAKSGTEKFIKTLDNANADIDLIGQFGVGFYSSFMIADKVEVITKKIKDKSGFKWVSDGQGEFSISDMKSAEQGTQVTLHLKEDAEEFLDENKIKEIVKKYSDHVCYPVELCMPDLEPQTINSSSALWMMNKSDITEQEYKDFYYTVSHSFDTPMMNMHWKAEGVISYNALLYVPSMKPYDLFDPARNNHVKLYVKKVFITENVDGLIPAYLRFMAGVVDSADLPLNVSREMLQHNPVLSKIRQGITKKVLSELKKTAEKKPEEFKLFWMNFGSVIKEGLYEDPKNRDEIFKVARFKTTKSNGKLVSLDEYIDKMKEKQQSIFYITGFDNAESLINNPHLEGFKDKDVEVLLLTDSIDSFWVPNVLQYKGNRFVSVTKASDELSNIDSDIDKSKDEKINKSLEKLMGVMKQILQDEVKDIKISSRLTKSPVCLVSDTQDVDMHMEQLLKSHANLSDNVKRILEINPKHSLIKKMKKISNKENAFDNLEDLTLLLFDQAKIIEGESVKDTTAFIKRMTDAIEKGLIVN
ncbi:MAG: molecular chaperone HtpG [Alphaproteobacteria bacterium]|nr:molecular chaperone HtpG [Alphaproteobacteria bacterium]